MSNTTNLKPLQYRSYSNQFKNWYKKPVAQTSSAVILTVFTIVFFGVAAIRPTVTTISRLLREIEDKQAYDADLTKKLSNLTSVQQKYSDNQETLAIFEKVLPRELGVNQLFAQIETISEKNGVMLNTVNTSDIETYEETPTKVASGSGKKLKIESYDISVSGSGTLENLNQWLFDLQNIERLVEVQRMSIRPADDQPDVTSQLNEMSVQLKVYWIPTN